jgi:hypothetical protein
MHPEIRPLRASRREHERRRPDRIRYDDMFPINCPRCQTPLTIRTGSRGTYYHCQCTPDAARQSKGLGRINHR